MREKIHITGKKAVKVLGTACLATGVVALGAVVASGAAVGSVAEGFKSAKNIMQKFLKRTNTSGKVEALVENIDGAETLM